MAVRTPRFNAGRVVVLALVVCLLGLTLAVPVRTYLAQQAQAADLRAKNDEMVANIYRLQSEKKLQNDPAWIEAQARDRLQYVMPGETPYTVQFPQAAPKTPEQQKAEREAHNPWYTNLWDALSVR